MPEIPMAFITHRAEGRLRLRIPSKKRDVTFFEKLQKKLYQCPGVEQARVNPITGSLLVLHQANRPEVIGYLEEAQLVRIADEYEGPTRFNEGMAGAFSKINRSLKKGTGGQLDLWGLTSLLLIGAGIYQISRGNWTAIPWYTAFYYAFNILQKSRDGGE